MFNYDKATKVAKDYQRKVSEAYRIYETNVNAANTNFQGDYLTGELAKYEAAYKKTYADARTTYIKDATAVLDDMRGTIKKKLGAIDTRAVESINALRGMKLSQSELQALVETNKANYWALRAVKELAETSGFRLGDLPADAMLYNVDKLEDRLSAFASYDGSGAFIGHKVLEILQLEAPFADLEREFTGLNRGGMIEIQAAEPAQSTNTAEQMKMVKNIFDASADKFKTASNMVNLGMTDFITGTEYEVYLPDQE